MKILDKAPSTTLAAIAGLLTMFAFLFLSPYLPYMTIYAQQTGPGGVPAAGGSSFTCNATNNCAALNTANTFTAVQSFAGGNGTSGPALSVGNPSKSGDGSIQFADYSGSIYLFNDGGSLYVFTNNYGEPIAAFQSNGQLAIYTAITAGTASNTDLRGHITLSSGSGTYSFAQSYTTAPTCVAADTTSQAPVKVSSTTTTLTLTGAGTDTLNYICAD